MRAWRRSRWVGLGDRCDREHGWVRHELWSESCRVWAWHLVSVLSVLNFQQHIMMNHDIHCPREHSAICHVYVCRT